MNERDSRASHDVTVVDATPAAIIPEEIHLANQNPATRKNLLHMGHVPNAERPLRSWLEHDRCIGDWIVGDDIAASARAIAPGPGITNAPEVLIRPLVGRPPGALPKRTAMWVASIIRHTK